MLATRFIISLFLLAGFSPARAAPLNITDIQEVTPDLEIERLEQEAKAAYALQPRAHYAFLSTLDLDIFASYMTDESASPQRGGRYWDAEVQRFRFRHFVTEGGMIIYDHVESNRRKYPWESDVLAEIGKRGRIDLLRLYLLSGPQKSWPMVDNSAAVATVRALRDSVLIGHPSLDAADLLSEVLENNNPQRNLDISTKYTIIKGLGFLKDPLSYRVLVRASLKGDWIPYVRQQLEATIFKHPLYLRADRVRWRLERLSSQSRELGKEVSVKEVVSRISRK